MSLKVGRPQIVCPLVRFAREEHDDTALECDGHAWPTLHQAIYNRGRSHILQSSISIFVRPSHCRIALHESTLKMTIKSCKTVTKLFRNDD